MAIVQAPRGYPRNLEVLDVRWAPTCVISGVKPGSLAPALRLSTLARFGDFAATPGLLRHLAGLIAAIPQPLTVIYRVGLGSPQTFTPSFALIFDAVPRALRREGFAKGTLLHVEPGVAQIRTRRLRRGLSVAVAEAGMMGMAISRFELAQLMARLRGRIR